MGVKDYIASFLLVGLIIIALISFSINFGDETSSSININNDSRINKLYSNVNESIFDDKYDGQTLEQKANSTGDDYENDETSGVGSFLTDALTSVVQSTLNVVLSIVFIFYDAILDPLLSIVMPNAPDARRVVGIVITSIFMFVMGLTAWRLFKTGR